MEAAHFPKEPVHTGLNILDRLPKKKKNTLKVTTLTSCMNFRTFQAVIKCFERSTVERIEETTLHKDGSSAVLNIALEKEGGKRKKKVLQHGVFVFGHPPKY